MNASWTIILVHNNGNNNTHYRTDREQTVPQNIKYRVCSAVLLFHEYDGVIEIHSFLKINKIRPRFIYF